jgi:hypothetical protein
LDWPRPRSRDLDADIRGPQRLPREHHDGPGTAAIGLERAPRGPHPNYVLLRMTHTRMPRG